MYSYFLSKATLCGLLRDLLASIVEFCFSLRVEKLGEFLFRRTSVARVNVVATTASLLDEQLARYLTLVQKRTREDAWSAD